MKGAALFQLAVCPMTIIRQILFTKIELEYKIFKGSIAALESLVITYLVWGRCCPFHHLIYYPLCLGH